MKLLAMLLLHLVKMLLKVVVFFDRLETVICFIIKLLAMPLLYLVNTSLELGQSLGTLFCCGIEGSLRSISVSFNDIYSFSYVMVASWLSHFKFNQTRQDNDL